MEDKINQLLDLFVDFKEFVGDKFSKIDERFQQIDERFQRIDEHFQYIDERFERINERFDEQHQNMVALNNETRTELGGALAEVISKLDALASRVDRHDDEITYLKSDMVVIKSTISK
jgi:archaellum component FlaC